MGNWTHSNGKHLRRERFSPPKHLICPFRIDANFETVENALQLAIYLIYRDTMKKQSLQQEATIISQQLQCVLS